MSKRRKQGMCQLCLSEGTLAKRSHIFPDFFYKKIMDGEKLYLVDPQKIIKEKPEDNRYLNTGDYDNSILCDHCENHISKFESYGRNIFYGHSSNKFRASTSNQGKFINLKNLDYAKLKLFFLSIIWKSSVSKREFYKTVYLGHKHEEIMRKMILNSEPYDDSKYPICIVKLTDKENISRLISGFNKLKQDGIFSYLLLIDGFLFWYKISSHKSSIFDTKFRIRSDGSLLVPVAPSEKSYDFIIKILGL